MRRLLSGLFALFAVDGSAQPVPVLPQVEVEAARVANPGASGTFAMPVTALRFEPAAEIHSRNLAEGQADILVRGGTFENNGLQIGAISPYDAQTGHYLTEIPLAVQMLSAPRVLAGPELATGPVNATSGALVYGWRPVRSAGSVSIGAGPNSYRRAEFYGGIARPTARRDRQIGVDVSAAHSESAGAVRFGDHRFDRAAVRLQHVGSGHQTDLFAGYQTKFFGWVNLYTPFNSPEAENLQTLLVGANHRIQDAGAGRDYLEAGAFHRRNKDDYAFNRFAPVGPVHPFQHTTWSDGVAVTARRSLAGVAVQGRADVVADEIRSTSLLSGRYRSRTAVRVAVVPEWEWRDGDGGRTSLRAGIGWDDSNRTAGEATPVFALARVWRDGAVRGVGASYTKTTQLPSYTALNSSVSAGLFRGNPDLGRTVSHNFEVKIDMAAGAWIGEAVCFWRRDDSLVDWTFRRGITARSANAVDVDVTGLELILRRSWKAVDLIGGYTALAKDTDYRGAAVDASFYALNYARHRLTAAVVVRLGGRMELRVDNAARLQAENALRTVGGRRSLATACGAVYRPAAWRGLEFSAQIENVWDSDFQDVPAVPAAPRQYSVGAAYSW